MSKINPQNANFFPKRSEPSETPRIKQPQMPYIEKNDIERQKEITEKTQNDAKVDISSAVKDFATIKRAVDNAPNIDNSQKVAELKQKIQNGTYKIDYDAVAEKILKNEF